MSTVLRCGNGAIGLFWLSDCSDMLPSALADQTGFNSSRSNSSSHGISSSLVNNREISNTFSSNVLAPGGGCTTTPVPISSSHGHGRRLSSPGSSQDSVSSAIGVSDALLSDALPPTPTVLIAPRPCDGTGPSPICRYVRSVCDASVQGHSFLAKAPCDLTPR